LREAFVILKNLKKNFIRKLKYKKGEFKMKRLLWILILVISISVILTFSISGCKAPVEEAVEAPVEEAVEAPVEEAVEAPVEEAVEEAVEEEAIAEVPKWKVGGVAIAGQFADADVVDLGGGQFRMYYAIEPEVQGNNLEVYSATSTNGKTWTKEDGTRKTMATFPDVVKLPDGTWRMYFQNAGVVKSATSTDGLTFTDEPGTRIDKTESGFNLDNVGAQSTTILPDGDFLMIYCGTINEPYQTTDKLPNKNTQLYFYATSSDGLTFTKKGIAIDSRDDNLYGFSGGAEFVKWNSGELRAYFWSYSGVYHTVYTNGTFSAPTFDFTNSTDSKNKFPQNPPCDPTLAKIKDTWYMYYGQHTKGIYYATLSE
jgi:hypothetical protein